MLSLALSLILSIESYDDWLKEKTKGLVERKDNWSSTKKIVKSLSSLHEVFVVKE